MVDYDEAIKNLQTVHGMPMTIRLAIEALEKQIPKKPLHLHKNYYCPICKEDGWMLWDDADPNDFDKFCCKCGQSINWIEIKEE